MRRFACLLIALLVCSSLVLPVMAEETAFIPSNGPAVEKAVMDEESVADCLVVTSVSAAKDKSTDITQEERDLLVKVYDDLSDGTMELPVTGDFRYLELSDVSFAKAACRDQEDHDEDAKLQETTLAVDFVLDVVPEGELLVFAYIDEQWVPVENAAHNGEGKVSCVFEEICPVVFIDRMGGEQADGSEDEIKSEDDSGSPRIGFVPSITYKDGLDIVSADTNMQNDDGSVIGAGIEECIVVTSISEAKNKSTDISQEDRDLLLEVYEKLSDGTMELPLEKEHVIKELVDISFEYNDCRLKEEHGHKDQCLKEDGITLTAVFDLKVKKSDEVIVMTYVDGEWKLVENVKNNGDGTVTCVFEDICPVAFIVDGGAVASVPKTGDKLGNDLILWVGIMAVCLIGVVNMSVVMNRKRK